MLVRVIVLGVLAGAGGALGWYFLCLRTNRRRAAEIAHWIERAFRGHAKASNVVWTRASRFRLELKIKGAMFRDASAVVELARRELPVLWLVGWFRRHSETLTFEADLDSAPAFDLEVHNQRWFGRTRRMPRRGQTWTLEQAGPYVLTTRNDWQREITTMMGALVASRECDCQTVSFHRRSPNFSVTVPLESIAPGSDTQAELFDVLRELAAGASAARF